MPMPSGLTFCGIAKETTKGTGAIPTVYIPVTQLDPHDVVANLPDNGFRGAMGDTYNEIAGPAWSTLDIAGDVFADTFPFFAAGILGDVATTGATAPFSHVMALKNSTDGQPVSFSITDHYGASGATPDKRFPGCQMSDLNLKFNADGLLTYTAKLTGLGSTLVAKPVQSFSTIVPIPVWVGTVQIGGGAKTIVELGEINMKRTIDVVNTVDGTQGPYALWAGAIAVDGKFTAIVEDETEMTRYLTNTNQVLTFDWLQGAGAALTEVKLQMSKCFYTLADYKRSTGHIQIDVTFKAAMNVTDVGASGGYSPIKATFQNALPSGTFG